MKRYKYKDDDPRFAIGCNSKSLQLDNDGDLVKYEEANSELLEAYKVLDALAEGDVPKNYTEVSNKASKYIESK